MLCTDLEANHYGTGAILTGGKLRRLSARSLGFQRLTEFLEMSLPPTVSAPAGTRLCRVIQGPSVLRPGVLPRQRRRCVLAGFELPTPVSRPSALPGPKTDSRRAVSIALVLRVSDFALDPFLGISSPSLTISSLAQLFDIFPSSSTTKQTPPFQAAINIDEGARNRLPAHTLF